MDLCDKGVKYKSYMRKLKMPLQRMEYLDEIREQITLRKNLWESLRDWKTLTEKWRESKFEFIDTGDI